MAKKKADKEIKRLKQRAKDATTANLALEEKVRKLKQKLDARKRQVADLRVRLDHTAPITEATRVEDPTSEAFGHAEGAGIACRHRSAWKQHSYLRDRYEFHLSAGARKDRARRLANGDLKQKYGTDCGYTEEELSAILS